MRTQETKVYPFDELSSSAKEHARDWWRGCETGDSDTFESVLDDAATIARMLGIDVSTRTVKLMSGTTRQEPVWYYSLDGGNGGTCFSGRYRHNKGAVKALRAYAPKDKELQQIARDLNKAQKPGFYCGIVDVSAKTQWSWSIVCEDVSDYPEARAFNFELAESALQDFAHWVYKRLNAEWDYRMSDECIDESIRANEYEFTEEGKRA